MSSDPLEPFYQRERQLLQQLRSPSPAELYEKIIEMGRKLTSLPHEQRREEYRVPGCQSLMYLKTELQKGQLHLSAHSDALISKGLAAMAISLYSGLSPELALRAHCSLAQELQLETALSLTRLGGFGSIITRIQRDALQLLITPSH